jgi:signal transduction histidine kinase
MVKRAWQRSGDALLALLFLLLTAVQIAGDGDLTTSERIGSAAMAVAVAVAISQRSRAPLALAVVVLVSILARPLIPPGGDGVSYGLAALVSVYTCAARLEGRTMWIGAALSAAVAIVLMITDGQDFAGVLFYSLLFGAPWAGGRLIRLGRQRQALLERQAVLLEEQRDEQARTAVADERTRIARELHDVVAHAISVVVLQARGGRRVLASDPDAAHEAFDVIEATSTQALGEMRRLLGLLRADDEIALAPQPTLARVGDLVGELQAAGLPVDVTVEGEPAPLPPGVDLSAYRIVQEALTNALKHAGPARAHVRVVYEDEAVLVEVTDDGLGAAAPALSGVESGGHGLVGIRERVAIVGGVLDAGPRPQGGYAVRARLPYATER